MLYVVEVIASKIWNGAFLPCVFFGGIFFTLQSRFLPLFRFPVVLRETLGKSFRRREGRAGGVTPFQAMCTALAGTVGTGSVVGTCQALALGGAGALFWLVFAAFLGMIIKFYEVVLSQLFRQKNPKGEWVGGPMYYLSALGKWGKKMGALYAAFALIASFGMGNLVQSGSISYGVKSMVGIFSSADPFPEERVELICAVVLFLLLSLCVFGGVGRVGRVAEYLVPFMSLAFVFLCLGVIFFHRENLSKALFWVLEAAFSPRAFFGGAAGIGMKKALEWGIKRSAFSNEAGLGSAGIAHAAAESPSPASQGFFGVFEVFVDTVLISTLTGLAVLVSLSPEKIVAHTLPDSFLITEAFSTVFSPSFSAIFIGGSLVLFAYSTLLGWSVYGQRCAEYLFGERSSFFYRLLFVFLAAMGAIIPTRPAWAISDLFNALMAIPNFIGLFFLSGTVKKEIKKYFPRKKPRPKKKI